VGLERSATQAGDGELEQELLIAAEEAAHPLPVLEERAEVLGDKDDAVHLLGPQGDVPDRPAVRRRDLYGAGAQHLRQPLGVAGGHIGAAAA
jgi:hypothetical protein